MLRAIALCSVVLAAAEPATTQLMPANAAGVRMGHVHLNVRSVEAHRKFWIEQIGAKPVRVGDTEGVTVPGLILLFDERAPTGPVTGEVINHIGLKVKKLADLMAVFEKFGSKTEGVRIGRENTPQTYVVAPDEFRIELVEDASLATPVVSHHLHYYLAQPESVQKWYVEKLQMKPAMRGPYPSGEVPGISLTFAPLPTNNPKAAATTGTRGRSLDHIGFEVRDLAAFCRGLKERGVMLDRDYEKTGGSGMSTAWLTDPWGVRIELTQGLEGQ